MSRAANDEPFNYVVARPREEDPRRLNIYTYGGDVQQKGTMQQALWLLAYVKQRAPGKSWAIYRADFTPIAGVAAAPALTQDERTRQFYEDTVKDPAKARAFLQDAGILDESDELAEPYRTPGVSVLDANTKHHQPPMQADGEG